MIEYKNTDLDMQCRFLLQKLEQDKFPLHRISSFIINKKCQILKVLYDKKVYGIILVRGSILINNEACLIVDHAIAEDNIEEHFSSILGKSLASFAANSTFNGQPITHVHIHAHTPGTECLIRKQMGKPKEFIFMKDVREFKNEKSVSVMAQRMSSV